ncbi:MAG: phosphoglucomutase [Chloroflexaceae bacterium]|nr:phosphoglucomutase [Chloroflexaceae bacterium]
MCWEGVFAADFTLEHVRRRCGYLSRELQNRGEPCLVAYDTRFMANLFARDIYRMLERCSVPVSLASTPSPLPAVYNALVQRRASTALVVSARNKPYWYNGLVLLKPAGADTLRWPEHQDLEPSGNDSSFPLPPESFVQGETPGVGTTLDLRSLYLEMLVRHVDVELIRRSTMTIFVDPIHGTTAGYLPAIIGEQSQTMAIEINRETDPLFNKFTPLPVAANLVRLRKLVRESDSHLGLAFSADGTALGMVDKNGEQVDQLEITLLLASYLARQYRQKGTVVVPRPSGGEKLVTMAGLETWQKTHGLKLELVENANARIAEKLAQSPPDLLIGGTSEGGLIMGPYSFYPDALLAGLLMVELVARSAGNLRLHLDELRAGLAKE